MALVVMDKSDYIKKMKELLEDTSTYRPLNLDPTNKQKSKLINILKRFKTESGKEDTTYRKMYPTGSQFTKTIQASQDTQEEQHPEAHCFK